MASSKKLQEFRKVVRSHWKKYGRHDLPWRKTRDPYKIMVSEVMLQQTQVPRVLEKYREFVKRFPTAHTLAKAPLSDVLKVWSGLGYNRRGKYLHDAAKEIVKKYKGIIPKDVAALRALPGMGPYTASAVRVFAFDLPDILIETNIRTVYIHHFFADKKSVRDIDLIPIATKAAETMDPREWHWALMDYGAYLKKKGVRNNEKSAHYVKQSKFKGSLREVRGAILKEIHAGRQLQKLPFERSRVEMALKSLQKDGLVRKTRDKWEVA